MSFPSRFPNIILCLHSYDINSFHVEPVAIGLLQCV